MTPLPSRVLACEIADGVGTFPVILPDPQATQTVRQLPDDLVVAIRGEQAQRQHQVHHDPGRQQPHPGLPTVRFGQYLVNGVPVDQPSEHAQTDHLGQPSGRPSVNIEVCHNSNCGTPINHFPKTVCNGRYATLNTT